MSDSSEHDVASPVDQDASVDQDATSNVEKGPTSSVELPEHVVERIESRLSYTNFETVDEYAAAALQGLVRELDEVPDDVPAHDVDSEADAEAIRGRLSSLGYL